MVNDCIRIALKRDAAGEIITSMRRLSLAAYHALAPYPVATCYRLTAIRQRGYSGRTARR